MWPGSSANKILDYLYLGDLSASEDVNFINKHNIQCIISIHEKPIQKFDHIEYKLLIGKDSCETDLSKYFRELSVYIHTQRDAKKSVLVHCLAGISRSATIVISYLMVIFNINYDDAMAFVTSKRSEISPNFGFIVQLIEFGKSDSICLHNEIFNMIPNSCTLLKCDLKEYESFREKPCSINNNYRLLRSKPYKHYNATADDDDDCSTILNIPDEIIKRCHTNVSDRPSSSVIYPQNNIKLEPIKLTSNFAKKSKRSKSTYISKPSLDDSIEKF